MDNDSGQYQNEPEIVEAVPVAVVRGDGSALISDCVRSGYGGCLPGGEIVDRRQYPDAVPLEENSLLGIPAPNPIAPSEEDLRTTVRVLDSLAGTLEPMIDGKPSIAFALAALTSEMITTYVEDQANPETVPVFPNLARMMRQGPATALEALIMQMLTVVTTHPSYSAMTWEEAYSAMIQGTGIYRVEGEPDVYAPPAGIADDETTVKVSGFEGKRMKVAGLLPDDKAYLECRLVCRTGEIPSRDSIRIGFAQLGNGVADAFEGIAEPVEG